MKMILCILKIIVLFNSVHAFWLHNGKPPWYTSYEDEYIFNEYEEIQAYEIAEIEEIQKKTKSPEFDEPLDRHDQVYADDITPLLRTLAIFKRKLERLGFYPIVSDAGLRYIQANPDSFEIADEYDEQIYELLNRPKEPKRFRKGYRPLKNKKKAKDRKTLTTKPNKYRSEEFPVNSNRAPASKYQTAQPYREPYYVTEQPTVPTTAQIRQSGFYSGLTSGYTSTEPSPKTKPTEVWTKAPHTTTYGVISTASNTDLHSSFQSNFVGPYFKEGSTKIPYRNIDSAENEAQIHNPISNENQAEMVTGETVEPIDRITTETNGLTTTRDRPPDTLIVPTNIIIDGGATVTEGSKLITSITVIPTSNLSSVDIVAADGRRLEGLIGNVFDIIGGPTERVDPSSHLAKVTAEKPSLLAGAEVLDPDSTAVGIEVSVLDNDESTTGGTIKLENITPGKLKKELTTINPLEPTFATKLPTTTSVSSLTLFPLQINVPTFWSNMFPTLATTQTSLTTKSDSKSPEPILEGTTDEFKSKVAHETKKQQTSSKNNREEEEETSTYVYEQMDVTTAPYEELRLAFSYEPTTENSLNIPASNEVPIIEITNIKPETVIYDLQQQPNESTQRLDATKPPYETPILTDSSINPPYQKQQETTTELPMTFLDLQTTNQLQTDNPSVSPQEHTESIEYYGSVSDPTAVGDSSSSFEEAEIDTESTITTTTKYDWDLDPKTENGRGFKGGGLNFLIEKSLPPRRSDILIEDDSYTEYDDNTIAVGK